MEDQRRDIHAAGGGAAPDHQPQTQCQTHAAEHGLQQQILRHYQIPQRPVQKFQSNGIEHGAEHGGHGKLPSQEGPAHAKHHQVEHQDEGGHGDVEEMLHRHSDARGAGTDQVGGNDEQLHRQGEQAVAHQHQQKGQQPAQVPFVPKIHEYPSRKKACQPNQSSADAADTMCMDIYTIL